MSNIGSSNRKSLERLRRIRWLVGLLITRLALSGLTAIAPDSLSRPFAWLADQKESQKCATRQGESSAEHAKHANGHGRWRVRGSSSD